ncbi:unnamed protein product [Amoebophrya sp. A120]|nr:unnamed protein product [Amoebophrya sp. A120]|eukprot:GSA120T00004170001.1
MTLSSQTITKISRALSGPLRHWPGMPRDGAGWVPLADVRARVRGLRGVSLREVEEVVARDSKQRYELSLCRTKIRAVQGHSDLGVEIVHERITKAEKLKCDILHGTSRASWEKIKTSGRLDRMSRKHVHLAAGWEAVSGMRKGSEVVLQIDVKKSMEKYGLQFWKSKNAVILTGGPIPLDCVRCIRGEEEATGFSEVDHKVENHWKEEEEDLSATASTSSTSKFEQGMFSSTRMVEAKTDASDKNVDSKSTIASTDDEAVEGTGNRTHQTQNFTQSGYYQSPVVYHSNGFNYTYYYHNHFAYHQQNIRSNQLVMPTAVAYAEKLAEREQAARETEERRRRHQSAELQRDNILRKLQNFQNQKNSFQFQ